MIDTIALAQKLIRCPSVTPADGGALDVLVGGLQPLVFSCHRLRFEESGTAGVENLYARLGTASPHFCFAGHSDVVPPGEGWAQNPFSAIILDDVLYGRGAADMKSALAAFIAATERVLANGPPKGSISLLITGDEEGPAINGTAKLLAWLEARGERIDQFPGDGDGRARACGLSAKSDQSDSRARFAGDPVGRPAFGQGQRSFRSFDLGLHQHGCGQS